MSDKWADADIMQHFRTHNDRKTFCRFMELLLGGQADSGGQAGSGGWQAAKGGGHATVEGRKAVVANTEDRTL